MAQVLAGKAPAALMVALNVIVVLFPIGKRNEPTVTVSPDKVLLVAFWAGRILILESFVWFSFTITSF